MNDLQGITLTQKRLLERTSRLEKELTAQKALIGGVYDAYEDLREVVNENEHALIRHNKRIRNLVPEKSANPLKELVDKLWK